MKTLAENLIQALNESSADRITLFEKLVKAICTSSNQRNKPNGEMYTIIDGRKEAKNCLKLVEMFKRTERKASPNDDYIYFYRPFPDDGEGVMMAGYWDDKECAIDFKSNIHGVEIGLDFRERRVEQVRKWAREYGNNVSRMESDEFEEFCNIIMDYTK